MRIYKFNYAWIPGAIESSVIIASSRTEAKELMKQKPHYESKEPETVDIIKADVSAKAQVIYAGYNCC